MKDLIFLLKSSYASLKDSLEQHKALKVFVLILLSFALTYPGVMLGKSGYMRSLDFLIEDISFASLASDNDESEVVIIGITDEDVDSFGGWSWNSEYVTQLIDILNANPEKRPAVIGLCSDVGSGSNQIISERLYYSANADNVVAGGSMRMEPYTLINNDGNPTENFYLEDVIVREGGLEENEYGFTNLIYDPDGIIRHHMLWALDQDGNKVYSFSYYVYKQYAKSMGIEELFLPETSDYGITMISYSRAKDSYYFCSIRDILEGRVSAESLADKIVLVGVSDCSVTEGYLSIFADNAFLPTVEIQANIIESYLQGESLLELPMFIQLWTLEILAFIMCFVALTTPFKYTLILYIAYIIGDYAVSHILWESGHATHPLFLGVQATVIFLCAVFKAVIGQKNAEQHTKTVLTHYMDESIVRELMSNRGSLENLHGSKKIIAVMFADVRNFTSMSENMGADDTVEILNSFMDVVSDCINRNGGTLDKFIGDCVMAFWGAPIYYENSAYLACKTALDISESISKITEELKEKYGWELSFGIGINFGEAVVGNIGSVSRMDFTAIGDAVNVASRLEGYAPGGSIYVSENVKYALGDRAVFKRLPEKILLKGKSEAATIYKLESLDTSHYAPDNIPEVWK